jgi:hypothetical protein
MKRRWFVWLSAAALSLTVGVAPVVALGGFGGSEPEAAGEAVRKLKLVPLDEKNTKTYGWVRISADTLSLGANRLDPDSFYTVYFENNGEKSPVGEEPTIKTSGEGEVKFNYRMTEPLGAKWGKLVLYQHADGNEDITAATKPVMEAKLR